ncbi:MAG: Flp pilus assembly complex ATPase component TadA [Candidatus Omnitrophica bacterium]|nr:Flp pilus assembly complex ATPase component TadA [Candidatus Omnitrophota bacterium]MCM8790449.1 Flp pilus assembly complex ATPase component TadA [Candidatus Omnitrophota bacterium]
MAESFRDRLINILINGKLITKEQLDAALDIQKRIGGSLGKILVWQGYISQKDLMVVMSRQLNIPPIDLSKYKVDKSVIALVPERIVKQYAIMPISKIGNVLTIAMSDPLNIFAIDDIKTLTNYQIQPIIATENDIKEAISSYYGMEAQDITRLIEESGASDALEVEKVEEEEKIDVSEVVEESKKAPIVKVVNLILNEAMKMRASDIHIEPREKVLRVRYRVDGNLQDAMTLPKRNQNAIIARLKIMSKLDITETRLPQDGRFKISFEGKEIDFRVSILPVAFGGKVVLRALDKSSLSIGLDKLGFLPKPLATFKKALARPYGMILVTGPTGSGKSTTLYSIITQLNTPERNIITLEDPVEYEVQGITQIQARPEIGLTFSSGLKSVLRQSPDIVMVGEIRDFETADIAIKASLTGQLILSTLHTNDAAGAITRLIDMGVEPFLVASSLALVSAQRLMRRICPYCKEEVVIPPNVLERAGLKREIADVVKHFYAGKGCQRCNKTGYHGRFGILEALLIDDAVREMIMRKASSDEIKNYGIKEQGMLTLRDNALENFVNGTTTLEEVLRVTSED